MSTVTGETNFCPDCGMVGRGVHFASCRQLLIQPPRIPTVEELRGMVREEIERALRQRPTQETVPAPEESILKAFERSPRRVQGTPADECTAKVRQHFDERRATTLSLSCECPAPPGQDCPLSVAECNERIAKRKGEPAQNRRVDE